MKLQFLVLQRDSSDTAAGIGMLSQAVQTAGQNLAAADISRRSERYNWEMWNVQRQAQIQDWWRTAAYNSPENQMKLLKAGGLNPNLIYGKSGGFQPQSIGSAPPSGGQPQYKMPEYANLGNMVGGYFNVKMQQQQLANQVAQNDLINAQADLARANADAARTGIPLTQERTKAEQIANSWADAINEATLAIKRGELPKLYAETRSILTNTDMEIIKTSTSVQEAGTRMLKNMLESRNLGAQYENIMASTEGKQLQNAFQKMENAYTESHGVKMPQQNAIIQMAETLAKMLHTVLERGGSKQVDVPAGTVPLIPGSPRPYRDSSGRLITP